MINLKTSFSIEAFITFMHRPRSVLPTRLLTHSIRAGFSRSQTPSCWRIKVCLRHRTHPHVSAISTTSRPPVFIQPPSPEWAAVIRYKVDEETAIVIVSAWSSSLVQPRVIVARLSDPFVETTADGLRRWLDKTYISGAVANGSLYAVLLPTISSRWPQGVKGETEP